MASRADISAGAAFVKLYIHASEFAHGLITIESMFRKSMGKLGNLLAEATPGNIIRKLTDGFTSVGNAAASMATKIGSALQAFGKLRIVAGATLTGLLIAAAVHFGHLGDEMQILSVKTGMTSNFLSGLGFAVRQTGGSIDDVEAGVRAMQNTIGAAAAGGKEATASLNGMGIAVERIVGLSPESQLEMIADGLAGIENPTLRSAAAVDVLGKGGTALIPILHKGSAGLREFLKEADHLGLIITPEQALMGEQLIDKFQALKEAVFASVFAVGEALGPALLDAIKWATELAVQFRQWVVDNKELVSVVAKIATSLIGVGAAVSVIGVGFSGIGAVLGVLTKGMSLFGHAVATILPFVTILHAVISLIGIGPIMAVVSAVGSAISSLGLFGGVMSLMGTALTVVLPEVAAVVGIIAAGLAGLTAIAVGAAAAAAGAAVAFWKLTSPIESLKPLLLSLWESLKNISAALFSGNFQSAGEAAMAGFRAAFLHGINAVMTMTKNALERLPGMINAVLGGISGAAGSITGAIKNIFGEMWPAIQLGFTAFASFAKDVLDQLPGIMGYVMGRVVRAAFGAMLDLQTMMVQSLMNLTKTLVEFGPRLIKAMFTGQVDVIAGEMMKALQGGMLASGMAAGLMDAEAPEFKISGNTSSAWKAMTDEMGKSAPPSSVAEKVLGHSEESKGGSTGAIMAKPDIDSTPIEKYRERLVELLAAMKSGNATPAEFAKGIERLRSEILKVDPSPLNQFRARVELLDRAFLDQVITAEEWREQFAKAQEDILGIASPAVEQYEKRITTLKAAQAAGAITQAQYNAAAKQAQQSLLGFDPTRIERYAEGLRKLNAAIRNGMGSGQASEELRKLQEDIFGLEPKPLDELRNRIVVLTEAFQSGAIRTVEEWREAMEKARKSILGIDSTPLEKMTAAMKALNEQRGAMTKAEFEAGLKKAKDDFLGFDSDPIATYTKRIGELRAAQARGDITGDQFKTAALEALPDKVKSIMEETRTPVENYKKDLQELEKLRPFLDTKTFDRKKQQLSRKFLDEQADAGPKTESFVTYSASALMASGRGSAGGVQDRILKATEDQTGKFAEMIEEQRMTKYAIQQLVAGMSPPW